jgi:hypothetical protein
MQGGINNRLDFFKRNAGDTAWTGCILFQSRQAQGKKAFPPKLDGRSRYAQLLGYFPILDSVCSHTNNPCALNKTQRVILLLRPRVQQGALGRGQYNRGCPFHQRLYTVPPVISQLIYDTLGRQFTGLRQAGFMGKAPVVACQVFCRSFSNRTRALSAMHRWAKRAGCSR